MYIVTTVEKSHNVEPNWLKEQDGSAIIGMGEDQSREAAYQNALREIRSQIAEEIGLELTLTRSNRKNKSDNTITSTVSI